MASGWRQRCVSAAYRLRVLACPAKRQFLAPDLRGAAVADLIRQRLTDTRPCMIGRWGATELAGLLSVWDLRDPRPVWFKRWEVLRGRMRAAGHWSPRIRRHLAEWSGFFPLTDAALSRFAGQMEEDSKELDVVGTWLAEEARVRHLYPQATHVPVEDLRPERHEKPWSEVLSGRRVLVVHPFADSIRRQYAKRAALFGSRKVLPEFELLTLEAVQTLGGRSERFVSWFDALDWMRGEIDRARFDVAIIGAGAYGMPLAAHVKRNGGQAVHLGGATQLMFGIMGKRWETDPALRPFVNEAWTRPSQKETPSGAQAVEGGCYW